MVALQSSDQSYNVYICLFFYIIGCPDQLMRTLINPKLLKLTIGQPSNNTPNLKHLTFVGYVCVVFG